MTKEIDDLHEAIRCMDTASAAFGRAYLSAKTKSARYFIDVMVNKLDDLKLDTRDQIELLEIRQAKIDERYMRKNHIGP